jgi:hypothetical protein
MLIAVISRKIEASRAPVLGSPFSLCLFDALL